MNLRYFKNVCAPKKATCAPTFAKPELLSKVPIFTCPPINTSSPSSVSCKMILNARDFPLFCFKCRFYFILNLDTKDPNRSDLSQYTYYVPSILNKSVRLISVSDTTMVSIYRGNDLELNDPMMFAYDIYWKSLRSFTYLLLLVCRAGHFRYFFIISIIKIDFFALFIKLITVFCTRYI